MDLNKTIAILKLIKGQITAAAIARSLDESFSVAEIKEVLDSAVAMKLLTKKGIKYEWDASMKTQRRPRRKAIVKRTRRPMARRPAKKRVQRKRPARKMRRNPSPAIEE